MTALPQGRKSRVEILPDGKSVRKTYNREGVPSGKYAREVGFYLHLGASERLPDLIDHEPDQHIVVSLVAGERVADIAHDEGRQRDLSHDYASAIADLFADRQVDPEIKAQNYLGRGASENRDRLVASLTSLATALGHPIIESLIERVSDIEITEELLIKLDWNAGNTFVRHGRIHKFIDFEQAFIGTREILVGILLHNPVWHAPTLFAEMRRSGFFHDRADGILAYLSYALGAVIADSVERSGAPWAPDRLERAYQKHVMDRFEALM